MAVMQVQTINGQKVLVPVSGNAPVNVVQSGNNNPVSSNAVANNTVPTKIYTDVDLNTLTDFGVYKVSFSDPSQATTLHYPSANYGTLIVNKPLPTSNNITQIFIPDVIADSLPAFFMRHIIIFSSSFGTWKKVYNDTITTGTTTQNGITVTWYRIGKVVDLLVHSIGTVQAGNYTIPECIPTPIQSFGGGGAPLNWGATIVGYLYALPPYRSVTINLSIASDFCLHHTYITTDD